MIEVPPDFERRERPHDWHEQVVDACVHVAGLAAAIAGATALIIFAGLQGKASTVVAVSCYAFGLLAMLTASAVYNIFYDSQYRWLFRRFDHSAIFVLIAGTYTPFTLTYFTNGWSLAATLIVWSMAAVGIALKWTFPRLFEAISVPVYLAQGWLAAVIVGPLLLTLPPLASVTIVLGGLLYSVGVLFHLRQHQRFHNAIWHCFVLAAAICHYVAVLDGVVLRPAVL